MLTEDYRVQLDAFEGPLDLLLFLIKRDEIDIHDIPVARITDQYLAFLEHIDRVDIDAAGEFLVTAATLLEIKSRMLAPRPDGATLGQSEAAGGVGGGEDPRVELVRQLLAYKAYRDAATALEQRADEWRLRSPAAAVRVSDSDEDASADPMDAIDDLAPVDLMLEDLSLVDLVEAFRRVAETVNFERIGTHNVTYDDTPIELHAQDILDRIIREGVVGTVEVGAPAADGTRPRAEVKEIEFTTIFTGRTRSEMVGLFLALLDLCRRRQVAFRHNDAGQIQVRARTEDELKDDAATVGRPDEVIG